MSAARLARGPQGPGTGRVDGRWHDRWAARIRRLPMFLGVGAVTTLGYGVLYLLLRDPLGVQWANGIALVLSTIAATDGHRRFTFGVHSHATVVPHQALGLAVLGAGLLVTGGSLWLLGVVDPGASWGTELLVLAAANAVAGTIRFLTFAVVMREPTPSRQ